jgi:hypothetical protein
MIKRYHFAVIVTAVFAVGFSAIMPVATSTASGELPTNFANLYQNRHGVAVGAWTKIHAAATAVNQELPTFEIFIGPNTKPSDKTSKNDLQNLFNYAPNNGFIKKVEVIYFNKKDIKWATDKATALMGPAEINKENAFKGRGGSDQPQQSGNPGDVALLATMNHPCPNAGDTTRVAGSGLYCNHDNSTENVWEAKCDLASNDAWKINNISGKCTAVNQVDWGIWVFPAEAFAQASTRAPSISNQPSPLIFCWTGDPNGCESSDSWVASDGTAYLGIGVPNASLRNDSPGFKGEAVALYYAMWLSDYVSNNSIVGLTQDEANKNLTNSNFPPYWMYNADEYLTYAIAAFGGTATSFGKNVKSQASAALDMVKQNNGGIAKTFGKTFNLTWINSFLDIKNMKSNWRQQDLMGNIGFSFGPRVMEILIAIKGPSVMFDLTRFMSQGKTFDQAFQQEFGVSWVSAEPAIAKTIWDEYQNNY